MPNRQPIVSLNVLICWAIILVFTAGFSLGWVLSDKRRIMTVEEAADQMERVQYCKIQYIKTIGPTDSLADLQNQDQVKNYQEQTEMLADAYCKDAYWNGHIFNKGWWNEGYPEK